MVVGIALMIFFVVEGLLIFAVLRFRDRPGALPPRQVHGNLPMEIAWTIIPTIVVAGIFWATIQTMENVTQMKPDALRVEVVGYQCSVRATSFPDTAHGPCSQPGRPASSGASAPSSAEPSMRTWDF